VKINKTIFFFLLLLFLPSVTFAQSDYVLPYPSFMPGNPFYEINIIKDEVLKFWYFGSFGQFKYNLKQSDKYLIEAKTLFEYKQYLLGFQALKKSDIYFVKALESLIKAKKENKDVESNSSVIKRAGEKHVEVLAKLKRELPESFVWEPEREKSTVLKINESIDNSIAIRTK
jgi:hypothetical protein